VGTSGATRGGASAAVGELGRSFARAHTEKGSDEEVKTTYITAYQAVQADLTATPTSGVAPLTVVFTNASTGDYHTCAWSFRDGGTSTDCNDPTHIYQTAGTYTVTLAVSGLGRSDIEMKGGYIEVAPPVSPQYEVCVPLVVRDPRWVSRAEMGFDLPQ